MNPHRLVSLVVQLSAEFRLPTTKLEPREWAKSSRIEYRFVYDNNPALVEDAIRYYREEVDGGEMEGESWRDYIDKSVVQLCGDNDAFINLVVRRDLALPTFKTLHFFPPHNLDGDSSLVFRSSKYLKGPMVLDEMLKRGADEHV